MFETQRYEKDCKLRKINLLFVNKFHFESIFCCWCVILYDRGLFFFIQDFLLAVAIRNIITYKICGPDEFHRARKLYQVVN